MQQIYCEPSYYEGGASGYSDGSYAFQESALRATFRQFLLNLRKRGLTGGHIIVATPDIGGVLRRAMGRRWPSFKTPEHVLYFDFPTLSAVLERAGLTNVRRLPYHHAFPMGLIAAKFGFTLPALLARLKVWVPATTIAAYGRVANR